MPVLFEIPKNRLKHSPRRSAGGKGMGPLAAFAVNPTGLRFETQQDDETVLLFLRQHFVLNVPWIILTIFLLFAPVILFPLLGRAMLPVAFPGGYIVIAVLGWYLVTFGFAFASFLKWFFNIYIVTNERIVDIDFLHLLYKQFSEARLINIQDISYKTGGIIETMFNFGHVLIQTAGTAPNFDFDSVPNPQQVVKIISEAGEAAKKRGV
jgi:hypothetical protein